MHVFIYRMLQLTPCFRLQVGFWGAPLFFGPVKTLKVHPILYYFKVLHVFLEWPCKYAV
jgi:hypothetical protein